MNGLPVQVADHGTAGQATGDAGASQGHGGRRLAQVVPDGPQAVHVAAAGAQAPRQTSHTALADTGVVTGVGHRRRVWSGQEVREALPSEPWSLQNEVHLGQR